MVDNKFDKKTTNRILKKFISGEDKFIDEIENLLRIDEARKIQVDPRQTSFMSILEGEDSKIDTRSTDELPKSILPNFKKVMNLLVASVISFSKEDLKAFGIFREHLKLILKVMDNEHTEEEIQEAIGADWLIYQNLEDLIVASGEGNPDVINFDCAVFDGKYVTGDVDEAYLSRLDEARNDGAQSVAGSEDDAMVGIQNS